MKLMMKFKKCVNKDKMYINMQICAKFNKDKVYANTIITFNTFTADHAPERDVTMKSLWQLQMTGSERIKQQSWQS